MWTLITAIVCNAVWFTWLFTKYRNLKLMYDKVNEEHEKVLLLQRELRGKMKDVEKIEQRALLKAPPKKKKRVRDEEEKWI